MAFFIKPKTLKLILTAFIFSAFFCMKNSVYAEISAECARLSKKKVDSKSIVKKNKIPCKTKFAIG